MQPIRNNHYYHPNNVNRQLPRIPGRPNIQQVNPAPQVMVEPRLPPIPVGYRMPFRHLPAPNKDTSWRRPGYVAPISNQEVRDSTPMGIGHDRGPFRRFPAPNVDNSWRRPGYVAPVSNQEVRDNTPMGIGRGRGLFRHLPAPNVDTFWKRPGYIAPVLNQEVRGNPPIVLGRGRSRGRGFEQPHGLLPIPGLLNLVHDNVVNIYERPPVARILSTVINRSFSDFNRMTRHSTIPLHFSRRAHPSGCNLYGVALTEDGKIYVVDSQDNALRVNSIVTKFTL